MSQVQNEQVIRTMVEALNARQFDVLAAIASPNLI
jgi:hypothetical protein